MEIQSDKCYVIYDGYCRLCNWWVRFLIRHDKKDSFRFIPSEALTDSSLFSSSFSMDETVVVFNSGKYFGASDAVLEIVAQLNYPWKIFGIFRIIPTRLRNWIYRWIARKRLVWFGKYEQCPVIPENLMHRFPD